MIDVISVSEGKIANYKKQIQDIKGVVRCAKCGAEVQAGAAFCSSCGTQMPKEQTSVSADMVKCDNCGALVKKGMRFCTECGSPMNIKEEVKENAAVSDKENLP